MADVEEQFGSVNWTDDTDVSIGFVITNATDANDAYSSLVTALAGTSFNGIPFQSGSIEEINENRGLFYGVGNFNFGRAPRRTGTKPDTDPLKDTFVFETALEERTEEFLDGNGTEPWTVQAVYDGAGTAKTVADPNTWPFKAKALGWNGTTKQYDGLPVLRPTSSFSLDYYPPTATVTTSYIRNTVSQSVGKVNSSTFNGYNQGEVLFTAARGSHTREDGWRFNFKFQVKLNRTNMVVAPGITIPSAQGWDTVEVFFTPSDDNSDGKDYKAQDAIQAIVYRKYGQVDLNALFP